MGKIIFYMILIFIVFLMIENSCKEGYTGKYILKSKIVPPVCPTCPQCPDLVNNCKSNYKCPPCPPCKRCPKSNVKCEKVVVNNDSDTYMGLDFGEQSRYNDRRINYKKYSESNSESNSIPKPWLNSFSQFG